MDMWVATAKGVIMIGHGNVAPDIGYRLCGAWYPIDRCDWARECGCRHTLPVVWCVVSD